MTTTERYAIPAAAMRVEIQVVNSRFIGSAAHTPSVEAAKDFIAQVRAIFPDATHHAYAYLVGHGARVIAGMSDAGEPSGTAGRPMLAVLRGSGLGDVTVVVTRYFGGTLLGTGGLVRAYSDATRSVLEVLPRTERIEQRTLLIRVAYSDYTPVRHVLEEYDARIADEAFATDITLTVILPVFQFDACLSALANVTAGQADVVAT